MQYGEAPPLTEVIEWVRNASPPLAEPSPEPPLLSSTAAAVAFMQLHRYGAAAQVSVATHPSDASGRLDTSPGWPPELPAA